METTILYEPYSKLLKGGCIGDYIGTTIRVIKGDTRSLDSSSYRVIVATIRIHAFIP